MPYYSELGLTSVPSSSAYSSLFLSGPYSNHSSIIASNYAPLKSVPRQFRSAYKPHLSTITELNTPARRIGSPKLLYQGTPSSIRPIKKINTADIDVSVNRYKRFEKYDRSKPELVDTKPPEKTPSPKKSPRGSVEEKEQKAAKPNTKIRRDRPTIRLQTVHQDTVQLEIGEIKSWRDNFKPEELGIEARRVRKSPGEILKEKFLIRSRSKENILKPETKKVSRKNSVRKSPSFQEICEAITSDNLDVDLNPGQPEDVQRKQSRQISTENILSQIRRNSTDISEEDLKILDAILADQESMPGEESGKESFESRSSVRKKRVNKGDESLNVIKKSHSKEKVAGKSLHRRSVKKRPRTPSIETEEKADNLKEDIYTNIIRDISQVEIEQTAYKPKPLISGSAEIGQTKTSLKAVVDDVEVQETPKPKKEKKFRFNVIVEVEDEDNLNKRSTTPKAPKTPLGNKMTLTDDHRGTVHLPKPKERIISSILKKRSSVRKGNLIQEKIQKQKPEPIDVYKSLNSERKDNDVAPTSPMSTENSLFNQLSPKKEESSSSGLFDYQSVPDAVSNKLKTSAPSSPLAIKRNFFSVDNSKSEDSRPSSPSILNKIKKLENVSTPTSPFGSKKNIFNVDNLKKENSRPSSPSALFTKKNYFDKVSEPTSPLASKRNLFSGDSSKGSSPLTTPINNSLDNVSVLSSPPANKSNLFNSGDSKSITASPPSTPKNKSVKNDSSPPSPVTSKLSIELNSKKREALDCSLNDLGNKTPTSSSPCADKIKLFSRENSKSENTPPSSPLFKKGTKDKFGTPPSSISKSPKEHEVVTKSPVPPTAIPVPDKVEIAEESREAPDNSERLVEKDENYNTALNEETQAEKGEVPKKLVSKRSLVQKANKDDPDLVVFVPPEPEPEPEPIEEKKDAFVPLQSNRLSQWMHPWKKPEQFEVCPVEIFARPKVIRGRHYPRPRGQPAPAPPAEHSSSEEEDDDEEETDEETSTEEETSEDECEEGMATKIGASTSSNDSGFGSGAPGKNNDCDVNIHKKCEKLTANLCGVNQKLVVEAIESVRKGSLESRDSPISNHANNPAFALDSDDIPEELSQSSTYSGFQKSGRITPPATTIPRFRKYCVEDFNFIKVLGKGSFGKVLLAELKGTEYYYAIKCLKKDVVLEDDDVECTLIERKVLALGTKHPYLCHLLCTFQTESHLFFVMEYLNGGDLMFHIQASGRFPEHQARFYGAEIVSGLKFLHHKGIVYRDLKLDNVLLDFDGHVRIADFGMCKLQIFLDRMAETFCGTPDYMAPEIIKGQHYNQSVDWWSFGVLLYEMLLGQSPFSGCDEDELFWSICNEKPVLPRFLSTEATNILTLFLEKDASKRLGNRFSPHGDIQDQPFFRPIDWVALEARQLEAPFKPNLQHPLDTQYFDKHFTVEKAKLTPIDATILQSMDQTQFQGFSYTNPNATDK